MLFSESQLLVILLFQFHFDTAHICIIFQKVFETEKLTYTWSESCLVVSDSLQLHGLYHPWNSLGQNTGVGSLFLLQGIFPTQGLNPGLSHCRQIFYQLSHKVRPRILEWSVYPFSSGSSQPRNGTGVSFIAGRSLTNWAIRVRTGAVNGKQNGWKQN